MAWDSTKPTVSTKVKDVPSILQENWYVMENWTEFGEHGGILGTSPGVHFPGECQIIKVGTTAEVAAGSNVKGSIAFDTTLHAFKFNTGAAWTNMGVPIKSGVIMLFYQDIAPIGWTIDGTVDAKLAYITKGAAAGGNPGGTELSGTSWTISGLDAEVGPYTLLAADIPAHTHTMSWWQAPTAWIYSYYGTYGVTGTQTDTTSTVGGGGSHDHTIGTFDGLWRPAGYCCIQCQKD